MIGLIVRENEIETAREFFQLFKTPWEIYRENRTYDVVIITSDKTSLVDARLIICYNSDPAGFDEQQSLEPGVSQAGGIVENEDLSFPIYGGILTFHRKEQAWLFLKSSKETVGIEIEVKNKKVVRIGYDLFGEISFLLSRGQPIEFAQIPTLEHHIHILRKLVLNSGLHLIEILPAPIGYNFIVCLTHDVDFAGIRRHLCDRTFFGFAYRALFGSIFAVMRRRISIRRLLRNWHAALMSPFVFIGLAEDFWLQFSHYMELEDGLPSTFFLVPFKNRPGLDDKGESHSYRSIKYDLNDIRDQIKLLVAHGCEIGVHGIDAWHNHKEGHRELEAIEKISGQPGLGIRMHWLYFSKKSPECLQKAGFLYDSSLGFNEAIGFRSGTTQVFCLPGADVIAELPMNIMDTALFFKDRMNLTDAQAWGEVQNVITTIANHGGVLTINWHQRSIAPERLWDASYISLLKSLRKHKAWFATGSQAIHWFQKRRAIQFGGTAVSNNSISIELRNLNGGSGPAMALRVYRPCISEHGEENTTPAYTDMEIANESGDIALQTQTYLIELIGSTDKVSHK